LDHCAAGRRLIADIGREEPLVLVVVWLAILLVLGTITT
jgi:hypothetical protein